MIKSKVKNCEEIESAKKAFLYLKKWQEYIKKEEKEENEHKNRAHFIRRY